MGRKQCFSLFGKRWKTLRMENTEDRKPGRKFSLPGPQISSSQIGRKIVGEKTQKSGLMAFLHKCPLESSKRERERERERERWRMRAAPALAGSLERS